MGLTATLSVVSVLALPTFGVGGFATGGVEGLALLGDGKLEGMAGCESWRLYGAATTLALRLVLTGAVCMPVLACIC